MSNSSAIPWTAALQVPLWDFLGKNIEVGCYFLLQGLFPTQGFESISPKLQADSSLLSKQGRCASFYLNNILMLHINFVSVILLF